MIRIEEPARTAATPSGHALWDLGLRPFYLLASAFSAVTIALWAIQFAGALPHAYLAGPLWHAHEMVFGFVLAVMVGFLLTAGRVWSGRETLTGRPLMWLALLWIAARVLLLTPWGWAAAIANAAFPLAAAVALGIPVIRARNRRNYVFIVVLVLLALVSLGLHAVRLDLLGLPPRLGLQVALDLVLFVMVIMAGRVIPAFTNNGIPGCGARRLAWLDTLALALIPAILLADLSPVPPAVTGLLLCLAALAHAVRLALWNPQRTGQQPLVWILHVAYAWIVLHLLLRGLAAFELLPASLATHALTTGAIGCLTLGMMTRTARGHTGRQLRADRFDLACYWLVLAAAGVRVLLPLFMPGWLMPAVVTSGLLWSAAFALYTLRYWPILGRPRRSGQAPVLQRA